MRRVNVGWGRSRLVRRLAGGNRIRGKARLLELGTMRIIRRDRDHHVEVRAVVIPMLNSILTSSSLVKNPTLSPFFFREVGSGTLMTRLKPEAEESEGNKVVRDRASSTAGSGMASGGHETGGCLTRE